MNSSLSARKAAEAVLPPMVAGLAVMLILLGLIASALHDPRPHDIPVGLVGPSAGVDQLRRNLGSAAPGAFAFVSFESEDAARQALDARQVDGALILGQSPRLILAGAAGDGVTGALSAVFGGAFAAQGQRLTVEVVHPFAAGDAHGIVLFFLIVAVTLSAIVAQFALLARPPGLLARVFVVLGFAAVAGPAASSTAWAITGSYGDQLWQMSGLVGLIALAVGAPIAAGGRLLGPAGAGLAALVLGPVSLVSSGGPVGSRFLPDIYRSLSPWLPASEAYSGLRGSLFFGGAGTAEPVSQLALWALAGIVLLVLFHALLSGRRPVASNRPAAGP